MSKDWTPTVIGHRATAVADLARQIDTMLWHVQQYKAENREEFADDLQDRLNLLRKAVREFNDLDTVTILSGLDKDITPFRKGIL